MKVTVRHPRDPHRTATFGADPERGGAYLDLKCDAATLVWDAAELVEDHADPILGLLAVLAMWGFLSGRDVEDALGWIGVYHGENFLAGPPLGWPVLRRPRRGVRRVLRVIAELELAIGGWAACNVAPT